MRLKMICIALALALANVSTSAQTEMKVPPVSPPPTSSSRLHTITTAADGVDQIRGLLNGFLSDARVKDETQKIIASASPELGEDEGFLIGVEVYEHGGTEERVEQIRSIGKGKTEIDAATKFILEPQLLPPEPKGMLRNEKASHLIWLHKKNGKVVVLDEPYPFAEMTMQAAKANVAARNQTPPPSGPDNATQLFTEFAAGIRDSHSVEVRAQADRLGQHAQVLRSEAPKANNPTTFPGGTAPNTGDDLRTTTTILSPP